MTEIKDRYEEMMQGFGVDEHMQAQTMQLMTDSGSFLLLPEEVWQAAENGRIPLETMLLEQPLAKWMIMVNILNGKKSAQHWDFVRRHLAGIRTRNDIRYDYLEMHMSNFWVSGVLQGDSTESVERLMREFAAANMRYARQVYQPLAFEEGQAVLPDHIRGAIWVEKAFACTQEESRKRLDCLGNAAREWPVLGTIIKHYASLLGDEEAKRVQEAAAASSEMAEIAIQVKTQILNLMDSGMYAEAYAVAEQLQQMTPEDEDLELLKAELRGHFS
ncbi:MAG: hypothetical protein NC180_06615 [Muribaculaceae bacterium]|nr:hypothetical protein [Roseburia sp.]MCM1429827.1 hypothetical protein [Muribaculaceae bacterium]MCM1492878.1 hypothetical protein [Muribaculaceae bacterium]